MHLIPGAFAMVGMAALLAGSVHAPLTAVILLFEMTNDYRIILPLMFAVVVSLILSQRLERESVYTLSLARKGIRLERGRDVDVLETITVEEVMQPAPLTLSETDTVKHARQIFTDTRHHGLPVLNARGELTGILTTQDLMRAHDRDGATLTVADIATANMINAFPDETIGEALRSMAGRDIGRMPVVSRNNSKQMVGWLRRSDLLRAYDVALTKRTAQRHRVQQVRLGAFSGGDVRVLEIPIERGSPCDGKRVREVPWPADCLVASLRKGRRVMIPHGDTVLEAGNTLVLVTEGSSGKDVAELCRTAAGQDHG
jgi:CIC family chloride channel protein